MHRHHYNQREHREAIKDIMLCSADPLGPTWPPTTHNPKGSIVTCTGAYKRTFFHRVRSYPPPRPPRPEKHRSRAKVNPHYQSRPGLSVGGSTLRHITHPGPLPTRLVLLGTSARVVVPLLHPAPGRRNSERQGLIALWIFSARETDASTSGWSAWSALWSAAHADPSTAGDKHLPNWAPPGSIRCSVP